MNEYAKQMLDGALHEPPMKDQMYDKYTYSSMYGSKRLPSLYGHKAAQEC